MLLMPQAKTRAAGVEAGSERRRGLRIRQTRPVKILDAAAARYYGGETQDVSATGLRLAVATRSQIGVGRILHIHVGLGESGQSLANRRQMMPVRVVWVDRQADATGRGMTLGVELQSNMAVHLDAA